MRAEISRKNTINQNDDKSANDVDGIQWCFSLLFGIAVALLSL